MSLPDSSAVLITDAPHDINSTQLDTHPTQPRVPEHSFNATSTHPNNFAPNHQHHTITPSSSPLPISEINHSPHRFRRVWVDGEESTIPHVSPARDLADEEWRQQTPNSPLLTAMREAVDSINQYEDFEILEKIGAGFFAEVFKVCVTVLSPSCVCLCMRMFPAFLKFWRGVACLVFCTLHTNEISTHAAHPYVCV